MSMLNLGKKHLYPLSHIPLELPVQEHVEALEDHAFIQEMDSFYLQMLKSLEPSVQKACYVEQLNRPIEALFRVNGVVVLVMFPDKTFEPVDDGIVNTLGVIEKPITVARISHILYQALGEKLSVEYFNRERPIYQDYLQGLLFNSHDLAAGLTADSTSIEEHMCEWLQNYQSWLQDYLYFNLAQIDKQYGEESVKRMLSLKPLGSVFDANAYERVETVSRCS